MMNDALSSCVVIDTRMWLRALSIGGPDFYLAATTMAIAGGHEHPMLLGVAALC